MRKTLLALLCAAIMVIGFAGCSKSNNQSSSQNSDNSSSSNLDSSSSESSELDSAKPEENSSSDLESSNTGKDDSAIIQEFLDTYKDTVLKAYNSDEDMEVDIFERDGKFVYYFKDLVNDYSNVDADTLKSTYESALESYRSVYGNLAVELESMGVSKGVIVIEYYDLNDNLLYSAEFTAEDAETSDAVSSASTSESELSSNTAA